MADPKVNVSINMVNPKNTDNSNTEILNNIKNILTSKLITDNKISAPTANASTKDSQKKAVSAVDKVFDAITTTMGSRFQKLYSVIGKAFPDAKKWTNLAKVIDSIAVSGYNGAKKISEAYIKFAKIGADALLESSKKMISTNSLFTDSATRDMMQQTGQTAAQAQGTQRALDRLGLSFDDLQTGKLTEAQAKAFESIRNNEITKLQELQSVGTSAFDAIQNGQMMYMQLQQDIQDKLMLALAKAGPAIEEVVSMLGNTIDSLMPIIDSIMPAITELFALLPVVLEPLIPVVMLLAEAFAEIVPMLASLVESIMPMFASVLEKILPILTTLVTAVLPVLETILTAIMPIVEALMSIFGALAEVFNMLMIVINPIIEIIGAILTPIFETITSIFEILTVALRGMAPILEMVVGVIGRLLLPVIELLQIPLEILSTTFKILSAVIIPNIEIMSSLMETFSILSPVMDIFSSILKGIGDAFEAVYNFIADIINNLFGWLGIGMPSLGDDSSVTAVGASSTGGATTNSSISNTTNYNYGTPATTTTAGLGFYKDDTEILNRFGY